MIELVLTGYPKLFPNNKEYKCFLGTWCFAGNDCDFFSDTKKYKKSILTDSYSLNKSNNEICNYIDNIYDRLLPHFTSLFNEFHRVKHSEQFWKINTVANSLYIMHALYDRYNILKHADELLGKKKLHLKTAKLKSLQLDNFLQLSKNLFSHELNLHLFTDIILNSGFLKNSIKEEHDIDLVRDKDNENQKKRPFTRKALYDYLESKSLVKLSNVYGIGGKKLLKILLKVDPKLIFRKRQKEAEVKSKYSTDNFEISGFFPENDFELLLKKILFKYLPTTFFEYKDLPELSRKNMWFGSNYLFGDEVERFSIAHSVENGGKWYATQHGAGYGSQKAMPNGKIEYETSGNFITWGWDLKHNYNSKYVPLPSPKLSVLPEWKSGEQAILSSTTCSAYLHRYQSILMPSGIGAYFNSIKQFLSYQTSRIDSWIYKPHKKDHGVNSVEFLKKNIDSLTVDRIYPLPELLKNCRLHVCSVPQTSMLESFVMSVPTIVFFNKSDYEVCDNVQADFDMLEECGIIYYSPEEASKAVDLIWDDPASWWKESKRQKILKEFCYKHARTSKEWFNEWSEFINKEFNLLKDDV
jgi:putative transferase (TIGR04331 family)